MEILLLPLVGIAGMYLINKQNNKGNRETFKNNESLSNTDIPDRNYPENFRTEENDVSSKLSTQNRYDDPNVYTDKYFNESMVDKNPTEKFTSLTGQPVDIGYFRHNNMAPYFGSKVHNNNASNATEATLDNYNGSGSQYISKKEQSPMFSVDENNNWGAYGMPSNTDFIQSRVVPSQKMANIKPFEPIQVGPGLGLGADTKVSNHGYNNGVMARDSWIDKGVDELRISNKQKASGLGMLGFEGPAKSFITKSGSIGIVEKNRVSKTFELGQDRLFTTTGAEKGHTLRPITVERHVNRPDTNQDYVGIAGYSNSSHQMESNYSPSTNIQLGPLPILPAYASGKGGGYENDYGSKSNIVYENNRTTTITDSYFGVVSGAFKTVISPLMDILRPSRRENTIGNLRPYQNAKASVSNSYVHNPNDQPEITNREVTGNSKYHLNVKGNQYGGYQTTGVTETHNAREITSDIYYGGNAKSNNSQPRNYDAEYMQRNNDLKSNTINGRLVPGNMKLMGSNGNMTSKPKDDMLKNIRPVDGKFMAQTPDINAMGNVQGQYNTINYGAQTDRTDGTYLSQLNDNPYNQNILNVL